MTKKDYELIGLAVQDSNKEFVEQKYERYGNHTYAANTIALNLADRLAYKDPKFNRTKFLQACGISN